MSALSAETLENFVAMIGAAGAAPRRRLTLVVPHAAIAARPDARRFGACRVAAPGAEALVEALASAASDAMTESAPPILAPDRRAARRDRVDRAARGLAALAIVAALAAGWLAWEARPAIHSIGSRARAGDSRSWARRPPSRRPRSRRRRRRCKEAQARLAELEARVADTQEQRVALEEMYRELSRSADDRVLSEVEQMLVLASQQLQLAGNVRGALAALQAADQRLARADKLAATPLRRAITQDMERLKALPQVDTVGIAVKLDDAHRAGRHAAARRSPRRRRRRAWPRARDSSTSRPSRAPRATSGTR